MTDGHTDTRVYWHRAVMNPEKGPTTNLWKKELWQTLKGGPPDLLNGFARIQERFSQNDDGRAWVLSSRVHR